MQKRLLCAALIATIVASFYACSLFDLSTFPTPGGYSVTYNANAATGGTPPTDTANYLKAQKVTVLGNVGNLVKTGCSFLGWNTQANGSGSTYTQGQTFTMGSANVTLYAQWTNQTTYTVTYNGNGNTGGTVPTDSNNYLQGATVTALGNSGSLVNTGFSFVGWNTQANGSGTTYTQGQTFSMGSANVTLYAVWTGNVATPTFTPNAGTYSSDQSVIIGDSTSGATIYYTVTAGTAGTTPTTSSTVYSSAISVAGNGTTETIEAMAVKSGMLNSTVASATYVVNYSQVSTPAFTPSAGSYSSNQSVTITDSTSGATIYYTTNGTPPTTSSTVYSTAIPITGPNTTEIIEAIATKSGMTTSTVASATYTILYQYSVTINAASGGAISTPSSSPVTVSYGTATNIAATANTGYSFVNWTVTSGSGVTFGNMNNASTTVTLAGGNATIQANFSLIQYALTVNVNSLMDGSSTPSGANTVNYGAATPIAATANSGYVFVDWTVTSGNGASFGNVNSASTTVTLTGGNATIQANFVPTYTVTYNGNGATGGSVPTDPNNYQQGATATVLGNTGGLTNGSYAFAWNTLANGSGTTYTAGQTFTMGSANVTLYAVWLVSTPGLSYTLNGNQYTVAAGTVTSGSVVIPEYWNAESVTAIGTQAFYNLSGLTSVTIPNTITSIGGNAFYYCTGLTSVTIPSSVTSIGTDAFEYCTGLTSVTIPSSITSIADGAFYSCLSLPSVAIPNSVTSIGDDAFVGCYGLTSVTIPTSVTSIGASSFYSCLGLTTVVVNPTTPPTSDSGAWFANCNSLTAIKVPDGSVNAYQSAQYWSTYASMISGQ